MSSSCEIAVVGAGPYGLSIAAHLRAAGVRTRVFGRPMDTWRSHMPEGMFLKSEGFASNLSDPHGRLTLRQFCVERGHPYSKTGRPVPLEVFTAYGSWFQEHAVGEVDEREVIRLDTDPYGFLLELDDAELVSAAGVVVATGVMPFTYLPPALLALPPALLTHASDHASFDHLRGRSVAVVGAGQSALESAVLLHEQGASVQLVARTAQLRWNPNPEQSPRPLVTRVRAPEGPLGAGWKLWAYSRFTTPYRLLPEEKRVELARTTLGPAGAWWLRPRLASDVAIWSGQQIVSAVSEGSRARLTITDGDTRRDLEVDHVIAGTGYRVDVDRLRFLTSAVRERLERVHGAPHLSAHFESSVPGLYFAGLPAANTFGPAMRFVCGTEIAAAKIAAHATRWTSAGGSNTKPKPRTWPVEVDRGKSGKTETASITVRR